MSLVPCSVDDFPLLLVFPVIHQFIMAKGNDDKNYKGDDVPHERQEPRPDFSQPPAKKQLPSYLQEKLDNEEKLWETLYEGK